jgi:hypothetical protein
LKGVTGTGDRTDGLIQALIRRLEQAAEVFGRSGIAEYVELYRHPGRMLWLNFLAGLARGFGIAVGFTAIGAVFLIFLARLAALNLPIIGEFVADVARVVQNELRLR